MSHPQEGASTTPHLTVARVSEVTTLRTMTTREAFDLFEKEADDQRRLPWAAYKSCFDQILARNGHSSNDTPVTDAHRRLTDGIVERVFHVYDTENTKSIRLLDLASGLTTLCAGTRDEKIKDVFILYGNQHSISQNQICRYLTAVYTIIFDFQPDTHANLVCACAVSPAELAETTAECMFKDGELDDDTRLSFEEFKKWCDGGDR
jgi:Ca2+-binding EF-hand superfamily protein